MYPKSDYLEAGQEINKNKSWAEIEKLNYSAIFPRFRKIQFLFSKEGLASILLLTLIGMCFYALFSSAWLWIEGMFHEIEESVYTTYRNWTTGILYSFISIIIACVSIDIHFINITDEIRSHGFISLIKKKII